MAEDDPGKREATRARFTGDTGTPKRVHDEAEDLTRADDSLETPREGSAPAENQNWVPGWVKPPERRKQPSKRFSRTNVGKPVGRPAGDGGQGEGRGIAGLRERVNELSTELGQVRAEAEQTRALRTDLEKLEQQRPMELAELEGSIRELSRRLTEELSKRDEELAAALEAFAKARERVNELSTELGQVRAEAEHQREELGRAVEEGEKRVGAAEAATKRREDELGARLREAQEQTRALRTDLEKLEQERPKEPAELEGSIRELSRRLTEELSARDEELAVGLEAFANALEEDVDDEGASDRGTLEA